MLNLVAYAIPSAIWAVFAAALFGVLCYILARNAAATFILFLPLIVLRLTEYISGVAIEAGAYMVETRQYGEATGAFARLLIIQGGFFLVAALVVEQVWPRIAPSFALSEDIWNRRLRLVWLFVASLLGLLTLYVAYLGLSDSLPIFSGEDRFAFRWRIDSPILDAFINNRVVFAPILGLLLMTRRSAPLGALSIVWMLVLSLAIGEKFTSLVNIITSASIPLGLRYIALGNRLPISVAIKGSLAISILVIPAILLAYGARDNLDQAVERLGERVSLQGQLWFVSDRKDGDLFAFDERALRTDISTWMDEDKQSSTAVGTSFGLYYVMSDFTDSRELRWIMETGNGFVFAQQPYLLKATGYVGLFLLMCAIAVYASGVMLLLAYALSRADIITSVLVGRIFVFMIGYFIGGFFWNLFGIKNLMTFGLIALALMLNRFRFRVN
ncbi:hypothetical protein KUV75_01020 [Qipengyuania gaetbuli]|uniref:DUF6418 domain-containing protein n=1 Tax=Qipengyuania gaetbuli TaxID=266952 RepID=UPI001C9934EA|nr:DUF6418 domain-containing protein [Qipengyuania gaetbuli]MBY6013488.1 hypothetical protein [Qipengyuania gaetbuli]